MIFDMYLNKGIGATKIANVLCEKRRVAASGRIKWTSSNVSRVLGNPTYMGCMAYGKSFSNNYLEQKRINNHNADTYMYVKADFEPIVTEEEWKKCESIRKRRRRELSIPMKKKTPFGEESVTAPKRESHDKWNRQLRCSCGTTFRKNRWHKNKGKEWSYGYQYYNQLNNGSAKKRREQGLDDTDFCDMQMIADWKLEVMCKRLMEEIWHNTKEAMIEACHILKQCYQLNVETQSEVVTIQKKISKLKVTINNLIDMRTDGDISPEEYRERRKKLGEELSEYERKLEEKNSSSEIKPEEGLHWDKIKEILQKVIDISSPTVDTELVDKFIAKIVPMGNNHYKWFVNLSKLTSEEVSIVIDGRKSNATVYIEEDKEDSDDEESSVHSQDMDITLMAIAQAIAGKKYSPETTQHRLQPMQRMRN